MCDIIGFVKLGIIVGVSFQRAADRIIIFPDFPSGQPNRGFFNNLRFYPIPAALFLLNRTRGYGAGEVNVSEDLRQSPGCNNRIIANRLIMLS